MKGYRATLKNFVAAQNYIPIYLCPSDPWGTTVTDPANCGKLDYFATVYTDINGDPSSPTVGATTYTYGMRCDKCAELQTANGNWVGRADGALSLPAAPLSAITDGQSETILVVEDAGRNAPNSGGASGWFVNYSKYQDDTCITFNDSGTAYPTFGQTSADGVTSVVSPSGDCTNGNSQIDPTASKGPGMTDPSLPGHVVTRWADPDAGGSGISGPPNVVASGDTLASSTNFPFYHWVNNNASPFGGPNSQNLSSNPALLTGNAATLAETQYGDCPWFINNCGLNDEPFSFHPLGCNAVFCDGSVHFLGENISPQCMRALVTRSEGANQLPKDEADNILR
jgi:prepilin-type processing-associated H-X9-DG protein